MNILESVSVTYSETGNLELPHLTVCNAQPYKTGLNVRGASDEEIYEATYYFDEMILIPEDSSWKLEAEVYLLQNKLELYYS